MESFGKHLMLDGFGADKKLLNSVVLAKKVLSELPTKIGMQKIAKPLVIKYDGGPVPEDYGVTGFVIIAESHISLHTFAGKGFITADVYSCKDFDEQKAIKYFQKAYRIKKLSSQTVKRGKGFKRT